MLFILGVLLAVGIMVGLERVIPKRFHTLLWALAIVGGFALFFLTI